MSAILKTVEATVAADGTVTLAEPVAGPARAVLTLIVEEPEPNAATCAAMDEPLAGLPRFTSPEALKAGLES